jgi:copper resistance protein B
VTRHGLLAAVAFVCWPAAASAQVPAPEGAHQHAPAPAAPTPLAPAGEDHSAHQPPAAELPAFIPPITDADRAAAFPDVMGHSVHDNAVNYLVLFDQLEWQAGGGGRGLMWDNKGWVGKDRNRIWFRAEGETDDGRLDAAQAHVFYGRAIARWWDVVAGVRQDLRPGGAQTWAAFGVQGLAPYWFQVEATAYVGPSGRTQLRLETEYELLVTNRLVLQPLVEIDIFGKADPSRGIGSGLSALDTGLRLRYEFRREFAPYVGVVWKRRFFGTADRARAAGGEVSAARLVVGLRVWK